MKDVNYTINDTILIRGKNFQGNGISVGYGVLTAPAHSQYTAASPDKNLVRLHFGTKGDYNFSSPQLGKKYHLVGGHCNMMYTEEFSIDVETKTPLIETFGVNFPKEQFLSYASDSLPALQPFCDAIAAGKSAVLSESWGGISIDLQLALNELTQDIYSNQMEERFILSKSIDLLLYTALACTTRSGTKAIIKTKTDKEKIIAARELVNDRLNDPPNLTEVARAVSLNEFKLKYGFKQLFGSTLFHYMTRQRLQLAATLLLDGAGKVQDIAAQLGYATPQHFITAFKKIHAVTPHQYKKSKKHH